MCHPVSWQIATFLNPYTFSGRERATNDGDAAKTVPGDGRQTMATLVVVIAGRVLDRGDGAAAAEVHRQI